MTNPRYPTGKVPFLVIVAFSFFLSFQASALCTERCGTSDQKFVVHSGTHGTPRCTEYCIDASQRGSLQCDGCGTAAAVGPVPRPAPRPVPRPVPRSVPRPVPRSVPRPVPRPARRPAPVSKPGNYTMTLDIAAVLQPIEPFLQRPKRVGKASLREIWLACPVQAFPNLISYNASTLRQLMICIFVVGTMS